MSFYQQFIAVLTYTALGALIFIQPFKPFQTQPSPAIKIAILEKAGMKELPLIAHLAELSAYSGLPQKISFIGDEDYRTGGPIEQLYYTAQNHLAPRFLNPEPIEEIALVLCSQDEISAERLKGLGYEWLYKAGHGKGLAKKL